MNWSRSSVTSRSGTWVALLVANLALFSAPSDKDKKSEPAPRAKPAAPAPKPGAAPVRPGPAAAPHAGAPGASRPGTPNAHSTSVIPAHGKEPAHHVTPAANGGQIHRDPSGRLLEVHSPGGAVIRHLPGGGRQMEIVRPGGRLIVAHGNGGSGYIQRPFEAHGEHFVQRTYVQNGVAYARVYRPYAFHGREYHFYARTHYYRPAFYGWAYAPYRHPYAYGWGWAGRPWYGYYGAYFTPFPMYASPAFWLADFVIATSLEAAYLAQVTPVAGAPAGAAPPMMAGQAPMSPEVKQAIAEEVRRQLEQAKAEQASAQDMAPASAPPPPIFTDKGPRVFLVGSGQMDSSGNQECALSSGAVLQLVSTPNPDDEWAQVKVLANRGATCPKDSIISVKTTDLVELHNQLQANLDQGLERLQTAQDKLPPLPPKLAGTTDAPFAGEVKPDPGAADEFAKAVKEANTYEQEALNPPAPPVQAAPVPGVAPVLRRGMSYQDVVRIMGNPLATVPRANGVVMYFIYKDLKVKFINGQLSGWE